MLSLALALWLSHHGDGPYDWHMTCDRFVEKRLEIILDDNFTTRQKQRLIDYFRSKVPGHCDQLLTYQGIGQQIL
jgi:hypothetical protein